MVRSLKFTLSEMESYGRVLSMREVPCVVYFSRLTLLYED